MRSTLRTFRWAVVAALAGLALMGGVRADAATGDQPTLSARTGSTFTFHPYNDTGIVAYDYLATGATDDWEARA